MANTAVSSAGSAAGHDIPFREALKVWLRVALLSFGGPAGQIAVMHRILVDEKRWISEDRFLHALNYCMVLPGPEAQQLATYIGWLLHRSPGGLAAGTLFVLPGFLSILALSILYAGFRDLSIVEGLFFGIKAAVLAVVVSAVIRIAQRALKTTPMYALAAAAFVAIFFFDVAFPLIIVAAAIAGFVGGRVDPARFATAQFHRTQDDDAAADAVLAGDRPAHLRPSLGRALRIAGTGLALWFLPLIAIALALGPDHVFSQIGIFFSKLAVVTFGGAYAVLAYMAQEAVQNYHWLVAGEMLDGLGMAETTPGPLIQVVQFVGFLGAFRDPGTLDPYTAAILASVLVTWVTFVPCFIWIFLGAPYVEALRGNAAISATLGGITAAVVGVVLNLSVWFGVHVLFASVSERYFGPLRLWVPDIATLEPVSLALAALALIAMLRLKMGMIPVLAASAAIGIGYVLLFP